MELERERGITIKSNTITLDYTAKDGETYQLNLIDTPGHVDFSHEVRRSLMSCEGALLLVDASQGVEAQTVANLYLALEYDLEMVPVDQQDRPAGGRHRAGQGRDRRPISGSTPTRRSAARPSRAPGSTDVLEAIVDKLPRPRVTPTRRCVRSSSTRSTTPIAGVVLYCRVKEGSLETGQTIRFMHTGKEYTLEEVGQLRRPKARRRS